MRITISAPIAEEDCQRSREIIAAGKLFLPHRQETFHLHGSSVHMQKRLFSRRVGISQWGLYKSFAFTGPHLGGERFWPCCKSSSQNTRLNLRWREPRGASLPISWYPERRCVRRQTRRSIHKVTNNLTEKYVINERENNISKTRTF